MKTLSREAIQRMKGGTRGAGSVGAGGGMVDLSGYATQTWVGENYVSIPFFNRLIQAFNGSTAVDPNDLTTAITNIKAMADLWSAGSVSALGYGSGGSGGATALSDLVDVQLSSPQNGEALVYDSVLGKWKNANVQSGGGSVTSVGMTVPTGFSISGSPITNSGTIALSFATGYSLPLTADVGKGVTAYDWGDHAQAGYATQQWVGQQGYLTSVSFSDLTSHPTTLLGYGITDAKIQNGVITLGSNTITPLTSVAFSDLTTHPTTLSGYGITDAKIQNGVITLGSNTITPLTSVAFSDLTSHPTTLSGYGITDAIGSGSTWWGASMNNGAVSGNMTNVGNLTSTGGLVKGFNGIELNTTGALTTAGGYIDFHYNGSTADYTSRIGEDASGRIRMYADLYLASGKSIRIGDGVISWDSTNNALRISRMSGSSEVAGDIYATGAVSSLEFSSGTPGDAAVNYLTVNGDTTMYGEAEVQGTLVINNLASLQDGFSIGVDGDAVFEDSVTSPKFMFDQTHYLYYSNSHLYFQNGSTRVTLV